jgi:hypothetical protein
LLLEWASLIAPGAPQAATAVGGKRDRNHSGGQVSRIGNVHYDRDGHGRVERINGAEASGSYYGRSLPPEAPVAAVHLI